MTEEKLKRQKERLKAITPQQWRVLVNDRLSRRLLFHLGGELSKGPHGEIILKGGRTAYGAHKEDETGENVLFRYQREIIQKLYRGEWEWPEGKPIEKQLEDMVDSMVTHERQKLKREKKKADEAKAVKDAEGNVMEEYESHIIEFTPERTSLDENYMRDASESSENAQEDDGGIGEEDSDSAREQEELTNYATDKYHHKLWEEVCAAADGDAELEPFVQKTGESQSQKEVNEALGLSSADRDRLQKKLKRRIQKLS